MEAMCFREDQYIDKFKHTLNHLHENGTIAWTEVLFMVIGKSLQNTLVGISLPKAVISNIYMRDGEPSLLTQPMMDIENISEMSKKQPIQLGHGDDAVVNLLKATMLTELYGTLYGITISLSFALC